MHYHTHGLTTMWGGMPTAQAFAAITCVLPCELQITGSVGSQESIMDKCHLTEKYNEAWKQLSISMPSSFGDGQTPTNPLLLAVPEVFKKANVKILFFGQETNDWEEDFPHIGGISHIIDTYEEFYLSGRCFRHGGQFWNGVSQLKRRLEAHFSHTGRTICLLWNNIVK